MHNVSEGKQSEAHQENRVSQACTAVALPFSVLGDAVNQGQSRA